MMQILGVLFGIFCAFAPRNCLAADSEIVPLGDGSEYGCTVSGSDFLLVRLVPGSAAEEAEFDDELGKINSLIRSTKRQIRTLRSRIRAGIFSGAALKRKKAALKALQKKLSSLLQLAVVIEECRDGEIDVFACTSCANNDGCCPGGCTTLNDSECAPVCGNGVVESGETCDGNCSSACPQNACSLRALQGSSLTCNALCVDSGVQTACLNSDGCCPGGCNANNDSDCVPGCGNGVVEGGEICDGNCPSSCLQSGCNLRALQGSSSSCNAVCVNSGAQAACLNIDGCCPAGCNSNNDTDCQPQCGNSVVEAGESCDGNCPVCGSSPACFAHTGSAVNCSLVCNAPILTCSANQNDGCCPFISPAAGSCGSSTDQNCLGSGWNNLLWPQQISLTVACTIVPVYGISVGGSYVFTTCHPPGGSAGSGDPVISSITDSNGAVLSGANDDCTNSSALPHLAGWDCRTTTSNGNNNSSCSGNNSGGTIITQATHRLDVRICAFNSQSTGVVPLYIWYNATSMPNPG